ncbi:class I SAM-dependent methyltransferase [Devosia nitrariae]|uniref:Methyltransferase n=1 Tax=Devosia nitrariae TaxID=2071872 RepID=A0ABQ5VZ49_9HYPH|nr:class I SAM-dependent methyltransferase [Devosia nitrariae]GLQ52897.1 methyltransferase [Devosia nitrariae]
MGAEDNGWEASASAWIADMGDLGDYGRRYVLDRPMLERTSGRGFESALDVGCGEGRFCRLLKAEGIDATGIEPTRTLRETALARDPTGRYLNALAEELPFEARTFDLVVSYLTLIDIDGIEVAITEMARVLKPGGSLLIANLNSFNTAGGWETREDGTRYFVIDNYLTERSEWFSWRGISIRNWHRPLRTYLQLLLATGLQLVHFDEPAPTGGDPAQAERYRRLPYFHIMEWTKP